MKTRWTGIIEIYTGTGLGVERHVYVEADTHEKAVDKIRAGAALVYEVSPGLVDVRNVYSEDEDPEIVLEGVSGWNAGGACSWEENPLFLCEQNFFVPVIGRSEKCAKEQLERAEAFRAEQSKKNLAEIIKVADCFIQEFGVGDFDKAWVDNAYRNNFNGDLAYHSFCTALNHVIKNRKEF